MIDFECDEAAAAHGIAATCTLDDHDRGRWLTYRDPRRPGFDGKMRNQTLGRSWTVCVGMKLALMRAEAKARRN